MRTLYHWPLDPHSRQARLALGEKKLRFKTVQIDPWSLPEDFLGMAIEGTPPLMTDILTDGKHTIVGSRPICEYVEDLGGKFTLLPGPAEQRAEARRLCTWFDGKFQDEVNAYILHERLEKTIAGGGAPNPPTLRQGREHLQFHLEYIKWLLRDKDWLAGNQFSLADIAAGANISCLDYLGEIQWKNWPNLKVWYQKLKSRPSFRPLLKDNLPGLIPPRHYADLDF